MILLYYIMWCVGELDLQEIKQSLINLGIKAKEDEIHQLLQRYIIELPYNLKLHSKEIYAKFFKKHAFSEKNEKITVCAWIIYCWQME